MESNLNPMHLNSVEHWMGKEAVNKALLKSLLGHASDAPRLEVGQ